MEEGHMEHNLLESILDGSMEPRDLPFSLLEQITDEFSQERRIGEGGFAVVYKGVLQNGNEVAVKRIMSCKTTDETLFEREVTSLMQVKHENIVRFLGFCFNTVQTHMKHEGKYIYPENRERLLCFEYIDNGSLDKYITDELRGLEWNTRFNIINGICNGLEYLHVKREIVHMDLKPANILLDNDMMAKITDFGLSRMVENLRTTCTNHFFTVGYCAPEYIHRGKITVKCDVYSLGVIIIELVTGHRDIRNKNNVLRRWRHRWNKSGQEKPFRYHQVAKLIEIGLLCQENDPYQRPSISEIIHVLDGLESTYMQISNADESSVVQISPYPEDDMLGIEPLDLCFPFELNKQMSCLLQLTNETNACIAFFIETTSPMPYCIEPTKDIVLPQSKYNVNITLQPLDKAPQYKQHTSGFIVQSTKVNDSLKSEAITIDMFHEQEGKVVDEVNLTVVHESLTISGTGNLNSLEASNGPAEAESKISSSTFGELIQFEPPELCFPLLPKGKVLSSINVVNITDYSIRFSTYSRSTNVAWYHTEPSRGILPPQSTQRLMVTREEKEDALKDFQFNDQYFVWNSIVVTKGVEGSDLTDYMVEQDSKELPIVLTKISLPTSDELIQFDPPELCFPFLPNKTLMSSVCIVNITDCYVAFNPYTITTDEVEYNIVPREGILPPRSTQKLVVIRVPKEIELEDMQCDDKFFVWNRVVTQDVEASDIIGYLGDDECKELPIVINKTGPPCISEELIQFDPPELSFPSVTNKMMISSVTIINNTDYCVGFNKYTLKRNVAWYYSKSERRIMPPRSTQSLVVQRVAKEQGEHMKGEDKCFLWNMIVTEGVEASDLIGWMNEEDSTELPIVLEKPSLCTADNLICPVPSELCFPYVTNHGVTCCTVLTNDTFDFVGFNTWVRGDNSALYYIRPRQGILPPCGKRYLTISRVPKEKESQDMPCKAVLCVWNAIVTEGVEDRDLSDYMDAEQTKEVPIVFIMIGESSSA